MRSCVSTKKAFLVVMCLTGCFALSSCASKNAPSNVRSNEIQGALAMHAAQELGVSEVLDESSDQPFWEKRRKNEIAPGFTLMLSNSADRSINGEYEVSFGGVLELPYDVQVQAEGRTPAELAGDLNAAYSKYIRNPGFRVLIQKRQYAVDVRGLVEEPGSYVLEVHEGLDAALGKARNTYEREKIRRIPTASAYASVNRR